MVDYFGNLVEGVGISRWIRHVAVSKTGVVRSDDVKAIRQGRNQIAVLVRGRGESMQQNELGAGGIPSLAISDLQSININGVVDNRNRRNGSGAASRMGCSERKPKLAREHVS